MLFVGEMGNIATHAMLSKVIYPSLLTNIQVNALCLPPAGGEDIGCPFNLLGNALQQTSWVHENKLLEVVSL